MPQRTDIEWADYSTNPLRARDPKTNKLGWACARVSAGCQHCYSATLNNRFGTQLDYTAQNIQKVNTYLDERELSRIIRFKPRGPFKGGTKRAKVFPFDMTDLFGEWVPFDLIDRVFAIFHLRPDVDFLMLTKRHARAAEYLTQGEQPCGCERGGVFVGGQERYIPCSRCDGRGVLPGRAERVATLALQYDRNDGFGTHGTLPAKSDIEAAQVMPNVWTGFSAEDQSNFDARWEAMRSVSQAGWLTWCSAEPLIGPIRLPETALWAGSGLKFVVVGGESGPGARPMHPDWARSLRDQCAATGVPYFFKQWGAWAPCKTGRGELFVFDNGVGVRSVGKKAAGRVLDGREHNDFPSVAIPEVRHE